MLNDFVRRSCMNVCINALPIHWNRGLSECLLFCVRLVEKPCSKIVNFLALPVVFAANQLHSTFHICCRVYSGLHVPFSVHTGNQLYTRYSVSDTRNIDFASRVVRRDVKSMSLFICLFVSETFLFIHVFRWFVCSSIRSHISETARSNFTKCLVHVA